MATKKNSVLSYPAPVFLFLGLIRQAFAAGPVDGPVGIAEGSHSGLGTLAKHLRKNGALLLGQQLLFVAVETAFAEGILHQLEVAKGATADKNLLPR